MRPGSPFDGRAPRHGLCRSDIKADRGGTGAVILALCLYVFHLKIKYVLIIGSISNSENKSNPVCFSLGDFPTFCPGNRSTTHP